MVMVEREKKKRANVGRMCVIANGKFKPSRISENCVTETQDANTVLLHANCQPAYDLALDFLTVFYVVMISRHLSPL
jgi:hypothetical protein